MRQTVRARDAAVRTSALVSTSTPTPAPVLTPSPASTTTDPSSTATTGLMAVVTPTTVEKRDTKLPNNKEIEGRTEGGEDERQQRREENDGSTKREERRDNEGIEKKV